MARRLTLVIHALNTGGAERVLALLANGWVDRGCGVTLITLDRQATDAIPLDARVRRVGLGLMEESRSRWQALRNNAARIRHLRRAICEARGDCVVSFTDKINVLASAACFGTRQRLVLAERNDPRKHRMSPGWERLRRWLYPRADGLVVQTQGVADFLRPMVRNKPVFVIPNAVQPPRRHANRNEESPRRIVGVGRLAPEKGFDLLIEAFSRIADRHADWKLRIIGDGSLRESLEQLAAERNVAGRIEFAGWLTQPADAMCECDLFVLPSRYEGFPNALLEAMACGMPVISFACDSGPSEIIRQGVDGWLAPPEDVAALASAMDQAIADAPLRRRFGERATEVVARFGVDAFFDAWEDVLRQIIGA